MLVTSLYKTSTWGHPPITTEQSSCFCTLLLLFLPLQCLALCLFSSEPPTLPGSPLTCSSLICAFFGLLKPCHPAHCTLNHSHTHVLCWWLPLPANSLYVLPPKRTKTWAHGHPTFIAPSDSSCRRK